VNQNSEKRWQKQSHQAVIGKWQPQGASNTKGSVGTRFAFLPSNLQHLRRNIHAGDLLVWMFAQQQLFELSSSTPDI
jgi:hypothetical protein